MEHWSPPKLFSISWQTQPETSEKQDLGTPGVGQADSMGSVFRPVRQVCVDSMEARNAFAVWVGRQTRNAEV